MTTKWYAKKLKADRFFDLGSDKMKSFRQLMRTPLRSLLGLLLTAASCAMLCLGVGQYEAEVEARDGLEGRFTTVAVPTNKYMIEYVYDADGHVIGVSYYSSQPFEIDAFIRSIPESYPQIEAKEASHGLISASCPKLQPINVAALSENLRLSGEGDTMTLPSDQPYTEAMLEVEIEKIGKPHRDEYLSENENSGVEIELEGKVLSVIALESGYRDPTGSRVRLTARFANEESFYALGLEKGSRCLAFGMDYTDDELELRRRIAKSEFADIADIYDDIDLSDIHMFSAEERRKADRLNPGLNIVAEYRYSDMYAESLSKADLDMIGRVSLTVVNDPLILRSAVDADTVTERIDGKRVEVTAEKYRAKYSMPAIVKLDGSAEEYLRSEAGVEWRKWQEICDIDYHAVPVIATPNIKAVAQFAAEEAEITEGRGFEKEEYSQGAKICVISDTLAQRSSLNVGDKLKLSFYELDESFAARTGSTYLRTANVAAAYYSPLRGFAAEEEFEIVGLYRQKNEWSDGTYAISPNTVFIPEGSVACEEYTSNSGIFSSMTIKNGSADELEGILREKGYEGLFVVYDQGYSTVKAELESFFGVSRSTLLGCAAIWLVLTAAFIILFPLNKRVDAERMLSLGAPGRDAVRHILLSGLGITVPGTVIGTAMAFFLSGGLIERLGVAAGVGIRLSVPPRTIVLIAVCQLAALALLILLAAWTVSKKARNIRGKKR